jgi:hypothetical protein
MSSCVEMNSFVKCYQFFHGSHCIVVDLWIIRPTNMYSLIFDSDHEMFHHMSDHSMNKTAGECDDDIQFRHVLLDG